MNRLLVELGERSYDILVGSGILHQLGRYCKDAGLCGSAAVITNNLVSSLYGESVRNSLEMSGNSVRMIEIPDGEEFKNSNTLSSVYDALAEAGMDRKSFIVALGGGVTGDLAGFAAATYMRGIPFVQVPTTLLAQVDSSVGGKTGIDHKMGKNLIGAFHQPSLVFTDAETLDTLADREFSAGLAETVKYGAVLDSSFFEFLEMNSARIMDKDPETLERVILQSCRIKAAVVARDEKESGERAVLNYGHTFGHAFETISGYNEILHGEAISAGMAIAARISEKRGFCSESDKNRIIALLQKFSLKVDQPAADSDKILAALAVDKKIRSGSIDFICNRGIGGFVVLKLTPGQLLSEGGMTEGWSRSAESGDIPTAWSAFPVPDSIDSDFAPFDAGEDEIIEEIEIIDSDEQEITYLEEDDDSVSSSELIQISDPVPLVTATVAELYEQQGLYGMALEIYRLLLASDPENETYREKAVLLEEREKIGTLPSGDKNYQSSGDDDTKIAELEKMLEKVRVFRNQNSAVSSA